MSGGNICFGVWKAEEPVFEITRDDLSYAKGVPPVTVSKRDPKDTFNKICVKWTDRSKDSGHNIAIANDVVDQRISGIVRKRTYNLLGITTSELATKMAYRYLAESMYRYSQYTFTLSYRSMTIEVGDVGTLTDGFGITDQRIRLTRITEAADGKKLAIEAVEDKQFLYLLPSQNYSENLHDRPTDPDLVEPNVYFAESKTEPIINIYACPQDEYFNGFVVYYSLDDETYNYVNNFTVDKLTCNIDGTIQSGLSSHPAVMYAPLESFDVAQNVLFIDLQPANDFQFFNNQRLMKIEDEVLAYKNLSADEDDSYIDWEISCLIRGLFGTKAATHTTGKTFHTLDIDFKFEFTEEDIGKTIYFKVLTYYGTDVIQLEDATAIPYVIKGTYLKPASVSITRIVGKEGFEEYNTDDFDAKVNLAAKKSGFNIGGFDVALWGFYARDPEITSIELKIKKLNDDLIYSEVIEIGVETISTFTKEITAAMRDGNDPVQISLTPGSLISADERKIEADDVRS